MAVFWAIFCMVFTAGNDLVFKFYARKKRPYGYFLAIIGVIFLITTASLLKAYPENWGATIFWGAVSGVFSILANILLLEGMRALDAGVCSTLYRLNLVPVVLGAFLLLGEQVEIAGWFGIGCALLAVIGFMPRPQSGETRRVELTGIFVTVLAALLRAGMGLSYRFGFLHGADEAWVVVINALCWIIGGLAYRFLRESDIAAGDRTARKTLFGYGLLSGVLVAAIVISMAAGLACGNASVVLPIAQMSFVLTGILGVILLHEKLEPRRIAAMVCGAAAILLLSL